MRPLLLLPLLIIVLISATPASASASKMTAVTLLYFRGVGQNNAVLLEWATGTEFNTAGFRLVRSDSETGQYESLDQIGFIPAEGDGLIGAEYEVIDSDNVVNNQVYWYELIEIELDGTENMAGPISATAGLATPTATHTPLPTATPTTPEAASSATATPVPTATPSAAATNPGALQATPGSISSTPAGNANQTGSSTNSSLVTPVPGSSTGTNSGSAANSSSLVSQNSQPLSGGYPAPALADVSRSTRESGTVLARGYPGADSNRPTRSSAAYPLDNDGRLPNLTPPMDIESTQSASLIGSQESGGRTGLDASGSGSGTADSSSSNTLLLWIGFITSSLVFAAGVIGSIIYFSRQRMQGR